MTKRAPSERREHPRLPHKLPLKIGVNGYDFVTTTHNVSCVGTYCCVNKYIPPFTKVVIKLALPIADNNSQKEYSVECKGVIVRTDDEEKGSGFNLAIFFNEIGNPQRQKISQYINQFLPHDNLSAAKV